MIGGLFFFRPPLHSDWLRVCQAGSRSICGIKSLQGVTRSDWEYCGVGGGEKGGCIGCCCVLLMCFNTQISFSCPQNTCVYIYFSLNAHLWCMVYLFKLMKFFLSSLSLWCAHPFYFCSSSSLGLLCSSFPFFFPLHLLKLIYFFY